MSGSFGVLGGLEAGSVIAGYRLEGQVGAGGMAVVFRARDLRLDRLVALKVLAPGLAADERFRRRFIAESRAAAAVDDPHIIPVYEAREAGGVLFIAMRFVAGGDLRRVLAREGPLPPGRAAGFISPVASALDAAHRAGLVHRDVKPANVLVDAHQGRPDHVYLSDFGVSKGAISSVSLTRTGQFVGTPQCAAPEQIQGQTVDGRADQYALACVAWQLLAGAAPFERDQSMAVLLAHLSEPPPSLCEVRPDLPTSVDAVLARALAKVPGQRYASCREFADALRETLGVAPYAAAVPGPGTGTADTDPLTPGAGRAGADSPSGPAGVRTAGRHTRPGPGPGDHRLPPSRPSRHGPLLMIALACAVLAIVAAILLALSADKSASPTALTDPHSRGVNAVAFRPGGTTLATSDGNGSTYLWNTTTAKATATLTDPDGFGGNAVAFGPGGTTLATGDDNGNIYLWNTTTGKVTATFSDPDGFGVTSVAFKPGGTTLATGDFNGSTYLWNTTTGKITATLTDPFTDNPNAANGVTSVAFGPGGTTLATSHNNGRTYLWNTTTGKITATLADPNSKGVTAVAFGSGSTTLATSDNNGRTYLWNTTTGKITATLTDPDGLGGNAVAFGPGGTTLAIGDDNGHIYLWNTTTRKVTATLTDPHSNWVTAVAFGPGGTTLATGDRTTTGDDAGRTYLWRIAGHNP